MAAVEEVMDATWIPVADGVRARLLWRTPDRDSLIPLRLRPAMKPQTSPSVP